MIKDDILNSRYAEKIHYIKRKQFTSILVQDKDINIRVALARMGCELPILINDESFIVRREVAYKGYGLDILINDKNKLVQKAALYYCNGHKDKLECKNILSLYNL